MRRVLVILGLAAFAGAAGALVACNAILGIDSATPEPDAGDGGGNGGDGGGGGSDAGQPLTCDEYCKVITANCSGPNAEYLTPDICKSMCPVFELGKGIADSLDNTLGCRLWHANAAAAAPQIHCRHAGPLGGEHCGDQCEAFCDLDTTYCSGTNTAYDGGFPGCKGVCNPNNGYDYIIADAGDLTLASGNTLNCRLWHLESAYASTGAAMVHCPHTALVSSMCQ